MKMLRILCTFLCLLPSIQNELNSPIYIRSASELLVYHADQVGRNSTHQITTISKITCLKECSIRRSCMFFGFFSSERKCRLYESSINDLNGSEKGWRFYRMKGKIKLREQNFYFYFSDI